MNYEYECAMTGLTQDGGIEDSSDSLGDLPVGWTRVQMTRRAYNPRWVMLQQVKQAMVDGALAQVPAEAQEMQRIVVTLQVDGQFHSMEQDTPMFLPDVDDVVYLSDSGEILDSINELRELLGLEALESDNEDDEGVPRIKQVGDSEDEDEDEDDAESEDFDEDDEEDED